jgi:hypothetical protein
VWRSATGHRIGHRDEPHGDQRHEDVGGVIGPISMTSSWRRGERCPASIAPRQPKKTRRETCQDDEKSALPHDEHLVVARQDEVEVVGRLQVTPSRKPRFDQSISVSRPGSVSRRDSRLEQFTNEFLIPPQ